MKSIPFPLKDDAKGWVYSPKVNSINSWDFFVDIFLKRYFPTSKPLGLGMKSYLLSTLNKSLFENT